MNTRSIVSIVVIHFLLNYCTSEDAAPKVNVAAELFRLPRTVLPEYYKLNVFTHINDEEGFKFFGDVLIKVQSFFLFVLNTIFFSPFKYVFGEFFFALFSISSFLSIDTL